MKIEIQFVDSKGFIHFEKGKSKKAVLNFCKHLHPNTESAICETINPDL